MRKTIIIGASALDINIDGQTPVSITPDGRMLSTALALSRMGMHTTFISEAARDRVGDIIVRALESAGVDTSCVDRYAGGHTPVNLRFMPDSEHPEADSVHYRTFPEGNFDAVWPRVSPDDIIVFGDYFAVAARNSRFIREFIGSCRQRRCIIVYAPGFRIHAGKQLTPLKPAMLDNLEWADFVIATSSESASLFDARTLSDAYRDSISFYCRNFIGLEAGDSGAMLRYFSQGSIISEPLPDEGLANTATGNAHVIAAIVRGLIGSGITCADLRMGLSDDARMAIVGEANLPTLAPGD